jgi:hypothetical protein
MDDICESKKPGKEGQECSKKRCGDDNVASTANLATLEDRILTVWMCSVDLDGHLDAKRRSLLFVMSGRPSDN